jgi:hypothetical protein
MNLQLPGYVQLKTWESVLLRRSSSARGMVTISDASTLTRDSLGPALSH